MSRWIAAAVVVTGQGYNTPPVKYGACGAWGGREGGGGAPTNSQLSARIARARRAAPRSRVLELLGALVQLLVEVADRGREVC